jgi:Predicted metalloendopeptidase
VNKLEKTNYAGGVGDLFTGTPADSDYKDNLYLAVNGAWQVKAKISPDKASAGASMILAEEIEKNLMQDFKDFAEGKQAAQGAEFKEAVKLYKMVKDAPALDPNEENPLFKDLKLVQDLNSLADLNGKVAELAYNNFDLPFYVGVSADMKDTSKNVV